MTNPDDHMRQRRRFHAERTAESHAAFLLPHLRPGMDLLDLGCGPGTITVGLAAAVAPGKTIGLDIDPDPIDGVNVIEGDASRLPFRDASFDAFYSGALLQHLPDPLAALREARRVARPGAVIGVCDADWDGELLYPVNEVLLKSMEAARQMREGTSPFVGKQLRHLLTEADFVRVEQAARVICYGTAEETRAVGSFTASLFQSAEFRDAWLEWGEQPGAFLARFWCEAIGWA